MNISNKKRIFTFSSVVCRCRVNRIDVDAMQFCDAEIACMCLFFVRTIRAVTCDIARQIDHFSWRAKTFRSNDVDFRARFENVKNVRIFLTDFLFSTRH